MIYKSLTFNVNSPSLTSVHRTTMLPSHLKKRSRPKGLSSKSKKTKNGPTSSEPKVKRERLSAASLPWKSMKNTASFAGIDEGGGMMMLEELDDVGVEWEEEGGARIARFVVCQCWISYRLRLTNSRLLNPNRQKARARARRRKRKRKRKRRRRVFRKMRVRIPKKKNGRGLSMIRSQRLLRMKLLLTILH